MSDDDRRPRWSWVVACLFSGAILVGLALLLEALWAWQGTVPSALVNIGTTLGLAGFLVLLEPLFTGRVIRAGQQAVHEAAAQVEEHLQRRTDELSARIDDLQAQVDQRMKARAQSQDRTVDSLNTPTFATVTKALTETNRLGALGDGSVTVQASQDPAGMALIFSWGTHSGSSFDPPGLRLDVEVRRRLGTVGMRPAIELEWKPEETVDSFAERMNAKLMKEGLWEGPDTVDWTLALQSLQTSLRLAITSRRREAHPWQLHAPLYEMVGTEWALTEAGIESRHTNSVLVPENEFPTKATTHSPGSTPETWPPAQPNWISLNEWTVVLERGKQRFPRRRNPMLPSYWVPFTGSESDHSAT